MSRSQPPAAAAIPMPSASDDQGADQRVAEAAALALAAATAPAIRRANSGGGTEMPLTSMYSTIAGGDQAQPDRRRPSTARSRCGRPPATTRSTRAAARGRSRWRRHRRSAARWPSRGSRSASSTAWPPIRRRRASPPRTAVRQRSRRAVCAIGVPVLAVEFLMIVGASGRTGSKKKVMPSSGLARTADPAGDHRQHDRLAERPRRREHRRRRRSPGARCAATPARSSASG